LEAFASEGYRSGNLTGWQIRQLLDLKNRFEVDSFMKRAGQFYRSLTVAAQIGAPTVREG